MGSAQRGLEYMGELVNSKFPNISVGDEIDPFVHTNVQIWFEGAGTDPQTRKVLYLDLDNFVYCNEIVGGNPCSPSSQADPGFVWGMRDTLVSLENDLRNSDYRLTDLYVVLDPDLSDLSLSEEELDGRTRSAAVVNNRDEMEEIAIYTILTTISVIVIILVGILLLTKDMSFLSRYLLRPLRELADDMESIAEHHFDAVSEIKENFRTHEEGHCIVGEVRALARRAVDDPAKHRGRVERGRARGHHFFLRHRIVYLDRGEDCARAVVVVAKQIFQRNVKCHRRARWSGDRVHRRCYPVDLRGANSES